MVRAAGYSLSSQKIKTISDSMDVDIDDEESLSPVYPGSTASKGGQKILIDAEVYLKIIETLERLTLKVENIQDQVEVKPTPKRKIEKDFQPKGRSLRRGAARAKEYNAFKDAVRNHACDRLGLDRDLRPSDWPTADPNQVKDYNSKNPSKSCRGPDNDCLRLDWGFKGVTNWTRDCANVFAADMYSSKQDGDFSWVRYSFTEEEVVDAFTGYIMPLKRKYCREVDDPMLAAEHQAVVNKRSRSFSRRKQLFGRRLALIKHHNLPKPAVDLVEALDVEGVSSEESEGEIGGERTFKVKNLAWRSPELTTWLHRIDKLPTKNSLGEVIHKRTAQRRRQTSDLVSESRPPVPSLKSNMYNQSWLQRRPTRYIKQLCADGEFLLPALDRYGC